MTEIPESPGWKFYLIIIIPLIVAIILLLVVGYPLLHNQAVSPPGGSGGAPNQTVAGSQVTVRNTPVVTVTFPATKATKTGLNTTVPGSSTTMTPVPQTTAIPPVPFSLSVTPQSASARPGDTLTYTLDIQHGEGLTDPIHMSLKAKVLFLTQTYDLGTIDPPFPKSIPYDFTVPGNLPSGVTVDGVITATGAGQTESQDISLNIL